jgi:steroid delta-isomerase-like uncharacterized protein
MADTVSPDDTIELLGRHLEAENGHCLADTLATLTRDCVFEDMALGQTFHGHEGATSYYRMWWDAFDTAITPERLHLAGDTAVAETTWRGSHVGEFLGIAPTKQTIDVPIIIVVEIRDGLMAVERLYWDRLRLIDQLKVGV